MNKSVIKLVCGLLFLSPTFGMAKVTEYQLTISKGDIEVAGETFKDKFLVNGTIPAPELTFHYGDTARIKVINTTDEKSLIHWHGIILPNEMDGVPFVNSPPIEPHSEKIYEFPIKQTGTYWYHSHVMFQEEDGIYGALRLLPANHPDPPQEDTVLLADLTHEPGSLVQRNLKRDGEYYDLFKDTVQSWLKAFKTGTALTKWRNSLQRMGGMDYADVAYDHFTANGRPKIEIFADKTPPEKVKLRLINGSATSIFKLTYAGGPITVIAADGLPVEPVDVNILPISVAETYDIIVTTDPEKRLELRATSFDNSGYSSILIGQAGKETVPAPDMPWEQPIGVTMGEMMGMPEMGFWQEFAMVYKNEFRDIPGDIKDELKDKYSLPSMATLMPMMAHEMDHKSMDHKSMDHKSMDHKSMDHKSMDHKSMDHKSMDHQSSSGIKHKDQQQGPLPATTQLEITDAHLQFDADTQPHLKKPLKSSVQAGDGQMFRIMNQAPATMKQNYLGTTGGLPHFNELTYGALKAKIPIDTNTDKPLRIIPFTLNGNMENYVWTINGRPLGPETYIRIKKGERVRFVMKNTTMMNHPMHLHGHFFRVMTQQGQWSVLKHTVNVAPLSTTVIEFAASEDKDWFFHCHILYHMMDGMTRIVRYEDSPGPQKFTEMRQQSKEFNLTESFFFRNKLLAHSNFSRVEGKFFSSYYQFEYDFIGNYEGNYEGEVHVARTLTRFLSLYLGGRIEQQGNVASESSPTIGFTWLLPLNIEVDLKYQPLLEEELFEIEFENMIQLTDRLQMNLEYSSIRNFYTELEWRQTKHLSFTANYNRTFDTFGVGLGYNY